MIKFIAGAAFGVMLGGGAILAEEGLPNPPTGQCIVTDAVIQHDVKPTFIEPDPGATGGRLYLVCGHVEPTASGGVRAVDALYVAELDVDTAELLVGAAVDLLDDDGSVYLP